MPLPDITILAALIAAAAVIYTSVGHAGASGYIAAMALVGLAPATMKPTALTVNILVAILATYRWSAVGLVSWESLAPLIAASIPAAFIGGALQLPAHWYKILVGLILLVAAFRLFFQPRKSASSVDAPAKVPWLAGSLAGATVGLLSGLTGTGGGIFLSPMLLLFGWAGARQASGITAPFILVNSIAGLFGNLLVLKALPPELPYLAVAALVGAVVGTQIGIRWASVLLLQRLLAVVLLIAATKFLFV